MAVNRRLMKWVCQTRMKAEQEKAWLAFVRFGRDTLDLALAGHFFATIDQGPEEAETGITNYSKKLIKKQCMPTPPMAGLLRFAEAVGSSIKSPY